jgi:tRNA U34 5-carboxymethylaminomethyl modifying GTPase MnmE/TrmE
MDNIDFKEIELFDGMTYDILLKKIHDNSDTKSKTILKLINDVSEQIKDPNSATLLVPLIAQYLDISVKNDEQLIKLASVIQRITKNGSSNEKETLLTEEEKRDLLKSVQQSGKSPIKRVK